MNGSYVKKEEVRTVHEVVESYVEYGLQYRYVAPMRAMKLRT